MLTFMYMYISSKGYFSIEEITNSNIPMANSKIKIKNATLDSLFAKSKILKIYTISLPKDPAKRATVRVRRVHLCTLMKG